MWNLVDTLKEFIFSFHLVGLGVRTQVIELPGKSSLNCFTSPNLAFVGSIIEE